MDRVYQQLQKKLAPNDTIVVGVSGGPDSMALLYMLLELRQTMSLKIICAHVNHGIRPESKDEEAFVANFCKKNTIEFVGHKITKYHDDNFQNEARKIRYNFFRAVVSNYQAQYLCTAHHGDDLMETILMRLIRGSTFRGYGGFAWQTDFDDYTILRPLIGVTKEAILQYNQANKVPYIEDVSNQVDKYTRNRIRKQVVNNLKKEEPNVHQKFYKFSQMLQQYDDYINALVQEKLTDIYADGKLDIKSFLQEDKIVQDKILYYILEENYQDDLMLINDQHVFSLHKLISSSKANAYINLPNDIKAVKSYQKLTLKKTKSKVAAYNVALFEKVALANGWTITKVKSCAKDNNDVARLLAEEVEFPLYVRSRKPGDRMAVKGLRGHKKINDIFIDEKIAPQQRATWPIVVDATDTILWIPGIKKSKFCRNKTGKYDIILKSNQEGSKENE